MLACSTDRWGAQRRPYSARAGGLEKPNGVWVGVNRTVRTEHEGPSEIAGRGRDARGRKLQVMPVVPAGGRAGMRSRIAARASLYPKLASSTCPPSSKKRLQQRKDLLVPTPRSHVVSAHQLFRGPAPSDVRRPPLNHGRTRTTLGTWARCR